MSRLKTALLATLLALPLLGFSLNASAEDFKGQFKFTSKAPKEDIFGTAKGEAKLDIKLADLAATRGTITVPVSTMQTGNESRDEHMKGSDWLDAAAHPAITFQITEVKLGETGQEGEVKSAKARVSGKFTLHGVTTPLTADAVIKWKPDGKAKITTTFSIKLADYKVAGKDGVVGSKVGETIQCEVALVGTVQ